MPIRLLAATALAALASVGFTSRASEDAWALPSLERSPREPDSHLATGGGEWQTLRGREWYNALNDVYALPGTNLMWAVGESQYGPAGVTKQNAMPIVCRSTDGGFYWDISQPDFPSDSLVSHNVTLYGVHFSTPNDGIAVGTAQGTTLATTAVIYRTGDGGSTWSLAYEGRKGPSVPIHVVSDLDFVDSLNGWAVGAIDQFGNVAILCTSDGGHTWAPQSSGVNAAVGQVDFVDANVGFAIANGGYTLATTDGGVQWSIASYVPSLLSFGATAMHFMDANVGLVTNVGALVLRTTNAGASWDIAWNAPSVLRGMSFVDANNGWAVGEFGAAAYTQDGGLSWVHVSSLPNIPDLWACVALDLDRLWVAGENGAIGYTLDRGGFWQNVTGDRYITTANLTDIEFVNEAYGWMTGDRGEMVRTTNGGETWSHSIHVNSNISGLDFVDPSSGWFATATDVWRTDDGGASWAPIAQLPASLIDVEFHDGTLGWASGAFGALHRTTDGGENWNTIPTGTTENLHAIEFASPGEGWAVGWNGTILHTTDGGLTWQAQVSAVVEALYDVSFVDELNGWIAGSKNIHATSNGGATWQVQHTVGIIGVLNGIHFVDAQCGIAVGGLADVGWIFMTSDGGATWTQYDTGPLAPQQRLRSVFVVSASQAYAAGLEGWVLRRGDPPTAIGDGVPSSTALEVFPSRPNPFGGHTQIVFRLASPSDVIVEIFDVAGRRVFERALLGLAAGTRTLSFDGRSAEGEPLPSGIYFQRITALGAQRTAKLTILR